LPVYDFGRTIVTVSNGVPESYPDRPAGSKKNAFVTITGSILGIGVIAIEVLWPEKATAIHDGLTILSMFILTARRGRRD
jgi:hypothetical protein